MVRTIHCGHHTLAIMNLGNLSQPRDQCAFGDSYRRNVVARDTALQKAKAILGICVARCWKKADLITVQVFPVQR